MSNFIFDNYFEILDIFGADPEVFKKILRGVVEKPIISDKLPVKNQKSKKPALQCHVVWKVILGTISGCQINLTKCLY